MDWSEKVNQKKKMEQEEVKKEQIYNRLRGKYQRQMDSVTF